MDLSRDSEASDALAPDTMVQEVFHKCSGLEVTMSNSFTEQFVSEYISKIFPWALNYTCRGPDFFKLSFNWKADAQAGKTQFESLGVEY